MLQVGEGLPFGFTAGQGRSESKIMQGGAKTTYHVLIKGVFCKILNFRVQLELILRHSNKNVPQTPF